MRHITIVESIKTTLSNLQNVLESLTKDQFTDPLVVLSMATIGQHTRHLIEFFQELDKGYSTGSVNYDLRVRNLDLEINKAIALKTLNTIKENLNKENTPLSLAVKINSNEEAVISTNYERELLHNLEHTIHHMAIIRIGIHTFGTIEITENFGVSIETLRYRKTCVQ